MEVTHISKLEFVDANTKHRSEGIWFKNLHVGTEGTPENYTFSYFRQNGFYSPRHHHNFDQFRYSVKGTFNLGPGLDIKQGQLAYHPEGVSYGPQDDGPQEQYLLVLQFGGASGNGYMSLDQIIASNAELMKKGKFEKGRYYPDGRNGYSIDGYEASWSHAMGGKKLEYPKGRYNAPIIMDPTSFKYKSVGKGVARKVLGVFSERETVAEMNKVENGAKMTVGGDNAIHLLYVVDGEGQIGSESLTPGSSVRLLPGSSETVAAQQSVEMLHFIMPMFE